MWLWSLNLLNSIHSYQVSFICVRCDHSNAFGEKQEAERIERIVVWTQPISFFRSNRPHSRTTITMLRDTNKFHSLQHTAMAQFNWLADESASYGENWWEKRIADQFKSVSFRKIFSADSLNIWMFEFYTFSKTKSFFFNSWHTEIRLAFIEKKLLRVTVHR